MPQPRWNTADLLDLEFLIQQDEGEDIALLAARDREIFAALPDQTAADAALLRSWLEHRKQAANKDNIALPGALWHELTLLIAAAAVLVGLISGGGLAFSFLAYSGAEPVNVAAYFAVFILLQLSLYLLLISSFLCGKQSGGSILTASLLYRLAGRLFFWLLEKCAATGRRASSQIAAENRLRWAAHAGSLQHLRQRHGLLLLRPVFLLAQLFGISFNIGVLAATLLKVIGSDLAFGWQSTLQIDAAAVHALTRWISLPWLWLPESVPTLAQIEGSRLILKDGIYHLASRDLASWWPFLCLSVLCYGLLPRLALLFCGLLQQRRDMARFDLRQGRFRQIVHRMRTPVVSTAARTEEWRRSVSAEQEAQVLPEEPPSAAARNLPPVITLLPDELATALPFAAVQEQLRRRAGYQLRQTVPFWTLDKSEAEELAILKKAMATHDCADVVIVHEAWQPPVQELLTWLAGLRRALGQQALIRIALIGRPAAENLLTPPLPEHVRIWRQKLAALGDSGLHVLELVDDAEADS